MDPIAESQLSMMVALGGGANRKCRSRPERDKVDQVCATMRYKIRAGPRWLLKPRAASRFKLIWPSIFEGVCEYRGCCAPKRGLG